MPMRKEEDYLGMKNVWRLFERYLMIVNWWILVIRELGLLENEENSRQ